MITIVLKKPGHDAEIAQLADDDHALREIIGGYIELHTIHQSGCRLDLFCDEDGKRKRLPVNVQIPGDVFVGTVVITQHDDAGDLVSLTENEQAAALTWLRLRAIG